MTLEQLKYMHAIVATGSFRAASESVYRSQSSLSISIQKLERELGIRIFTRDSYRPALTKPGKAIYQKALALLKKEREMHDLAKHLAAGSEAELKLAISGVVPIQPIIGVLNQVAATYPKTRMTLLIENLGGTMERIRDDEADITITDTFDFEGDFESTPLPGVRFVSVVPSSSPWAGQSAQVTEQALENETLIVVRDTSIHSKPLSKGIIEGSPQWVVNDFATKRQIICSGKGWGRMPLHLVAEDIAQERLTLLPPENFPDITVPINLVRKKQRPKGPVEQALWLALQQLSWHEQ